MSNLHKSILTIPRCFAGLGLLGISIFKLYAILNSGIYFASMLSLCITGYFVMDAANVFLLWMAAFGLFLGASTRVVALFALFLVGTQIAICFAQLMHDMLMGNAHMNLIAFDLIFLSTLVGALVICVTKGGGPLALWSRGWRILSID